MTKTEAIAELSVLHERLSNPKDCEDGCYSWEDGWYVEAIDMAIEALSADAEHGEWILVKGSNGKDYHKCSKCLHTQEITGVKNYCAVCGARMIGGAE